MAVSHNNVVTFGLSGKIGDLLVFRKQNGKTIVGKVPAKSSTPPTVLQIEVKDRFKLASKFAKQAIQDSDLLTYYRAVAKKGQRPFNAAFADFFIPPTVSNPTGVYNGQAGTVLGIRAMDNYEVKEVKLVITQADDTLIEQGDAVLQINGVDWAFTCTTSFATPAGCKLIWTAIDWAENAALLELEV